MSGRVRAFAWAVYPLANDYPRCDGCLVYRSQLSIALGEKFINLCHACAGRLRSTTKEIQRAIQADTPKKVRP